MHFRAETPPKSPLIRVYLKAGCQGLGSCPLGKVESPLRRLCWVSVLTHLLNCSSCLAFPTGSLSTERENSVLLSGCHRVQDKSICREKQQRVCKFCRQLSQAPDISCMPLSCLQLLPEVFCHSPNLSRKKLFLCCLEIVGTGSTLRSLGLQELQLYLLTA